jgi:hypothetical protein
LSRKVYTANSGNVAKNQHLIPQTYLRNWCYSKNSVWTINKKDNPSLICTRNIEKINSINFHYDIKAGDLYTTISSLEYIFGFLDDYEISFEGIKLDHKGMNEKYLDFDHWFINKPDGRPANKTERNIIKDTLQRSRYTFIETEWSRQYENSWSTFIIEIERKVITIEAGGKEYLSSAEMELLMKYLIMFDWRSKSSNSILNEILDLFCELMPEFQGVEIQNKDRIHKEDRTIIEEIRNSFCRKAYYEFLNDTGTMKTYFDSYRQQLTFAFCITDLGNPFITSDNPAFMFTNKNNWKEHVFVVLPTLLLTTCRTDEKGAFLVSKLSAEDVLYYNKVIAHNGELLILPNDKMNISELLIDMDKQQ